MKSFIKLALTALVAIMASLGSSAKMILTYQQAVQLVKAHRTSQSLDNDSVNFYAAQTDTVINNYCCPISGTIPSPWASNTYGKILVLVDEKPLDLWRYDCSYYYLPRVVNDLNNVQIIMYEGKMAPNHVNLTSIDINLVSPVRARIPQNLANSPAFPPSLNSPNIGNGNQTQVLIMVSHYSDLSVFTNWWNNCASLYCVLTQVYNIPKQNIHLFMGDEISTTYMYDSNGDSIPMLRDLDGDGINENIQPFGYGALDDFRDDVADSLALAGVEHLFTFYIGNLGAYVPWDYMGDYTPILSEGVDVMDFEATISRCQADYNTVFCCCMDANRATSVFNSDENFILIGANYYNYYEAGGDNDGDPDNYFKPWLAAMAGQDLETGNLVDADYNNDGFVSMAEANTYAESIEVGNMSFMHSTPSSIASNVSFGHLELYKGLNITIDGWESPDIWVRNQNDGRVKQEQDELRYSSSNPDKYIYVRVSNVSTEDYDGGIYLQLYWKKPVLGVSNSTLFNSNNYLDKRGYITTIPLNQSIASGQDTILSYQWSLPTELITFAQANNNLLPVVVMAELTKSSVPITPKNIVATNGLLRLNVKSGKIVRHSYPSPDGISLIGQINFANRIPVYFNPVPYCIGVSTISHEGQTHVYSRDSLSTVLSPNLASNTTTNGYITRVGQSTSFNVNGEGSILGITESTSLDSMVINIETSAISYYQSASSDKIGFNIYSAHEIEQSELNCTTPVPYGTMPIEFFVNAENFGPLGIQSIGNNDNSIDLSASHVSSTSDCSWYNREGLMGTGSSLHLNPDEVRGAVQLIAIDEDSGYVGQAFANLDELVTVSHIGFTNNGNVEVALTKPASQNLSVQAVSTLTGNVVATGQIVAGNVSLQLPASVWPNGTYLVSVINGSTIVRTVQLMKQ